VNTDSVVLSPTLRSIGKSPFSKSPLRVVHYICHSQACGSTDAIDFVGSGIRRNPSQWRRAAASRQV